MFSTWLENQLNKHGFSASDLAKRSGVSNAEISRLLSGQRDPSLKTLQAISSALSVPVYNILEKAGIIESRTNHDIDSEEIIQIPFCGNLPRSIPVSECKTKQPDTKETMPMTRRLCHSRNCIAFIVQDKSLSSLHIKKHDILIIDRDSDVENGDAVAVCLDDLIQVRGYYKKDGDIVFTPFSNDIEPVIVSIKDKNWHIIGKVVHAVKHFTKEGKEQTCPSCSKSQQ